MHLSAHVAMSVGFRINGDKQLKNTSSVIQMSFKKYSKSKSAVLLYTYGANDGARTHEMPEPQSGVLTNFTTSAMCFIILT